MIIQIGSVCKAKFCFAIVLVMMVCIFMPSNAASVGGVPISGVMSGKPLLSSGGTAAVVFFNITSVGISHTIECDYLYSLDKPSICGDFEVTFPGSSSPRKTQVRYTNQYLELWVLTDQGGYSAEHWVCIYRVDRDTKGVFPMVNRIYELTEIAIFEGQLKCIDGYEQVFEEDSGVYCRWTSNVPALKTVPPPGVNRTESNVFYAMDCQKMCQGAVECMTATFDYVARECHIHTLENIQSSSKVEKFIPGTDRDVTYVPGDKTNVKMEFGNALVTALEQKSEGGFMDPAKKVAHQVENFGALMQKSSLDQGLASLLASLSQSILRLSGPGKSITLPARDGKASINTLKGGKDALSNINSKLISYRTDAKIADLKSSIFDILEKSVDADLDKDGYDFKFFVMEFNSIKAGMAGSEKKAQMTLDVVKTKMERLKQLTEQQDILNTILAIGKLSKSIFSLADPFSLELGGSVSACIDDIQEVVKAAGRDIFDAHLYKEMTEGFNKLADAFKNSAENIAALSKTADFVLPFIASFQNHKFSRKLTTEEQDAFIAARTKYVAPFDMSAMKEANGMISSSVNSMCEYLLGQGTLINEKYTLCREMKDALDQVLALQGSVNGNGNDLQLKANQIISKYISLSHSNDLHDYMHKTVDQSNFEKADLLMLQASAYISLKKLISRYMLQMSQICNLADYYVGEENVVNQCTTLYAMKDVMKVDDVFQLLWNLENVLSTVATSSHTKLCRYVPTQKNDNGDDGDDTEYTLPSFLDIKGLARDKSVFFQFPMDTKWLNKYGWDAIARKLDKNYNYFVDKIQVTIPYASYPGSTTIALNVRASNYYKIHSKSGPKNYMSGVSSVDYLYDYSMGNQCDLQMQRRNTMEPCSEGPTTLPKMCVEKDGSIQKYAMFDEEPIRPSLFSPFQFFIENKDIEMPKLANVQVSVDMKNGTEKGKVLENNLLTTMCLDLVEVSKSSSVSRMGLKELLSKLSPSLRNYQCNLCPPGNFHQAAPNQAKCLPCPIGTYQDERGWFTCKICPDPSKCKTEGKVSPA
eukprot:Nk52_evm49s485 gene=Nk52_evmTU49s485